MGCESPTGRSFLMDDMFAPGAATSSVLRQGEPEVNETRGLAPRAVLTREGKR